MKTIKITLAGQDYHLVFNGIAMFEIDERFGGASKLFETMQGADKAAFSAVCEGVSILAEQGELTRRALGYDPGPILSKEDALLLAAPMDRVTLQRAVMNAMMLGFGREIESEDAIDLGLLELEQKKTRR